MLDSIALKKLLPEVSKVAIAAGDLILDYYRKGVDLKIQSKADHSPVTAADLAAHHFIETALRRLAPLPVLSEESPNHKVVTQSLGPYWLVDPLDGTKDFIEKTDEFTVNIALVQGYKPLLGVVHAPVFAACYFAVSGYGAFKVDTKTQLVSKLASLAWKKEQFTVLISRRHNRARIADLQAQWPGARVLGVGSSYKFCLLAEGSADVYLRTGPTSIWDTAAGHCVLEAAGGQIFAAQGQRLMCDPDVILNPAFVALGDARSAELQRWCLAFLTQASLAQTTKKA